MPVVGSYPVARHNTSNSRNRVMIVDDHQPSGELYLESSSAPDGKSAVKRQMATMRSLKPRNFYLM